MTVTKTRTKRETWMDWIPPEVPKPQWDELITREELLDHPYLRLAGVREGDLQYWEYNHYLPKAIRKHRGGVTRAVYPKWYVLTVYRLKEFQDMGLSLPEITPHLKQTIQGMLREQPNFDPDQTIVIPAAVYTMLSALADHLHRATGKEVSKAEVRLTTREPDQRQGIYTPVTLDVDRERAAREARLASRNRDKE
jgi:DNA-binding transcriptional MerR regulator